MKYVQDLNKENSRKHVKEELNKWKNISYSYIEIFNIIKIPVPPILICRLKAISIKIIVNYSVDIDKLILKFICKGRRPRMVKLILKKNKARRLTLSNFKTHYKSTIIKTVWYFQIQFSSVAQSCLTLCDPMDCSVPGVPIHHQLPDLAQTHVHRVGDDIQSFRPLFPFLPAFNRSQHQDLFQ